MGHPSVFNLERGDETAHFDVWAKSVLGARDALLALREKSRGKDSNEAPLLTNLAAIIADLRVFVRNSNLQREFDSYLQSHPELKQLLEADAETAAGG